MDRLEIIDKLVDRIRPLTEDRSQAEDFAKWYLDLGPKRVTTIVRELMEEEKCLSQHILCEHERKMMDIKIAKNNLEKVVEG